MRNIRRWSLGAKLALVAVPFLTAALCSVAALLYMSWQIEGGGAAVNEAGRMRMQAYRLVLSSVAGETRVVSDQLGEFERSLQLLRSGDAERPLFVPWDDSVRQRFADVERDWTTFRGRITAATSPAGPASLGEDAAGFTLHIDAFVAAIEARLSRWTSMMHLLQVAMMAMAVIGTAALVHSGYRFVLEPLGQIKQALLRIQGGDFGARVERTTTDEFGTLAEGFNDMAEQLQSMYHHLENRVLEKTAQLEKERGRLESLYEVTTLITKASTLEELAHGFTAAIARISRADGVAMRWTDETHRRFLMLASQGLPQGMSEAEHCLVADDCHCGSTAGPSNARVIPIRSIQSTSTRVLNCAQAGFETVVSVPIRLHERLMGELDLFFHAQITLTDAERSLLELLAVHLAGAMENMRLGALGMEAAISEERGFLARELHDSIAQSLAFLKIQVQLMREALAGGDDQKVQHVLGEIDVGVRESYGDVRELLMHFRTRTNGEDIEPALLATLRKFEHQTGLKASLQMFGHGMPLPPDVQIQVLHIVQEALSNVRKHSGARRVWLDVQQEPQWRLEVRDDGLGFHQDRGIPDETHVGMRIMVERAERLGAQLDVISTPGRGTSVVLTLPPISRTADTIAAPRPLAA